METYLPLYLRHRPQTLSQLVGQRSVVQTLTNAIDNDRIAHAYLFTGPRGTGKTSSARILAKSLNCEKGPTADPCMVCTMCTEIKQGISPAVMEIDAASNNSVDDARVLIERAPLVAQGGRFKLYIIDECHMLTKEAFNALLKTIEEPPPKVIFILATTEEHKVPPTIISRCQRLMFKLVSHQDLTEHLRNVATIENIHIDDEALALIARRSGGGMRDAMGLLDQASLLATPEKPVGVQDLLTLLGAIDEDVLMEISSGVKDRDGERVLTAVHSLLAQGREPSLVALELSKHFLNMTKALHLGKRTSKGDGAESILPKLISGSSSYIESITRMAPEFEGYELTQMVEHLDRMEQTLRRSTQPALSLEVGLLSLCHRQEIHLVKDLVSRIEELERAIAGGAPMPAARYQQPAPHSQPPQTPQPTQAPRPEARPEPRPEPRVEPAREQAPAPPPAPQPQAAPPPQAPTPAPAPPQPAPKPAAAPAPAPSGGETFESTVPMAEVDEFWSNMLEELKTASIPTFSLVSQFGFPLALRDDELVIGVMKETFQKTLEGKAEHIKAASKRILGKELFIKVKVQTGEIKPQASPKSNPPPAKENSRPAPDFDQERSQPTPREPVSAPSGMPDYDEDDSEPEPAAAVANLNSQGTEPRPKRADGKAANIPPPETGEQLMVKEAYKLFEGPGSRSIG